MTINNSRNPQAEAIFRGRYNGKANVMTPRIWSRRMIATGNLAVELSEGDGIFRGSVMWAVTVLVAADPHSGIGHDLSQCFSGEDSTKTRAEAEAYIESLRAWRPAEAES